MWQGQSESLKREDRNDRLAGIAKTSGELAEWPRLQHKNLKTLGLTTRKEWPQRQEVSSCQKRQSSLAKKKIVTPISPDHQIMRW